MKHILKKAIQQTGYDIVKVYNETEESLKIKQLYQKYREFTMIPEHDYINNLLLCARHENIEGAIVECGVWRGGMIASIAELLGNNRKYFLFDSFEGLPAAEEIDGEAARDWQNDKTSPGYHNNCTAEVEFAEKAMSLSGAQEYKIEKGWFNETLIRFSKNEPIAILRLDADWYESTMECFDSLYPQVQRGGLIIIDDYYTWDGCARAVHDYMSKYSLRDRISQFNNLICYIIKQ